jgi:hypothetical protein
MRLRACAVTPDEGTECRRACRYCQAHPAAGLNREESDDVVPPHGRALWQTRTSGIGNHLILQTDGNMVLYTSKGKALWQSGTRGPGASFSIGQCGDLLLFATNFWEERPPGCDTATTGDVMTADQQLAHQGAGVTLQSDGNLVDTFLNNTLWCSHTSGNPGDTLHVQKDGNVVIYSSKGKALWSTGTAGAGPSVQFSVTGQGILKVVKAGKVIWQAG